MITFKQFLLLENEKDNLIAKIKPNIIIPKKVKKELKKLAPRELGKVVHKLNSVSINPYHPNMKKMFDGSFVIRAGKLRIIYNIRHGSDMIDLVSIGLRKSVYSDLGLTSKRN